MVSGKWVGFLQYDRFLSFKVVFHFHDYERKSGLEEPSPKINMESNGQAGLGGFS